MKFYGRAADTAAQILAAFQTGNVPAPLAQVFISRPQVPMSGWSVLNQFVCLLNGCTDARGYQQWQEVGRWVKRGAAARAAILVPLHRRCAEQEDEQETRILYGFKGVPVFDISQTEGEPLPEMDDAQAFCDTLPLLAVAQAFGLDVTTYAGQGQRSLGMYSPARQWIGLGVENLSTWFHELVHAADDRLGNLQERGQHWRSEIVAELGGATLATLLGLEVDADLGGCWQYVQAYAAAAEMEPISACVRLLERMAQAIDLILTTADKVASGEVFE